MQQTDEVEINQAVTALQATPTNLPRWRGFELLVTQPVAIPLLIVTTWPRWIVMWLLCGWIYAGCKWLTWRRSRIANASVSRQLGYLLAWPGMDADRFLNPTPANVRKPLAREYVFALSKLLLGLVLLVGITRLVPAEGPLARGWIGMFGLIFVLHFGLFHLLSCLWRAAGVDAPPQMNWPMLATSLSDFWGRRWNAAFRDLTHRYLFRPLLPRWGAARALFAVFLLSGVIHEAAITLPARGGYGGPTCYFLLQAGGLLIERSPRGKALGLGRGWRGWVFSMLLLVLPLGLLFPPVFVREIIVPMLHAIGAL